MVESENKNASIYCFFFNIVTLLSEVQNIIYKYFVMFFCTRHINKKIMHE